MDRHISPQARRTQLDLAQANHLFQKSPRIRHKLVLQKQLHRVHPQGYRQDTRQKYWTSQQTIVHMRPLGRVQHVRWRTRPVFSAATHVPQKDQRRKRNSLPHTRNPDVPSNLLRKSVRFRYKRTSCPRGIHSHSRTETEPETPLLLWIAIRANGLWDGFARNVVVLWRVSGGRARLVGK